jgi:HAMP domain-containing protein
MSDGIVGGRLESLTDTQSAMDATADRAADSGSRGVQVTQQMESGLQEITQVLQTEFNALATEFRELAQQTQARLDATEWTGRRKEQAVAIGAEFEADVRRVLDESEGYIEQFRTQAIRAATECVEAMQAGFGGAMERANESYRNLGVEAATVRDQLSEIDRSSGRAR